MMLSYTPSVGVCEDDIFEIEFGHYKSPTIQLYLLIRIKC